MELKSFGIKSGHNSEVATNSGPKPGDFPLGSLESRAATRVMLGKRPQLVITVEAIGTGDVIERIFMDLASGQTRVETRNR
jgi:hypothetical protein